MQAETVKLDQRYFGRLWVGSYLGKNGNGEKLFECFCACGALVTRTQAQLAVRRLSQCPTCRSDYVEEALDRKRQDQKKNWRRNAHH